MRLHLFPNNFHPVRLYKWWIHHLDCRCCHADYRLVWIGQKSDQSTIFSEYPAPHIGEKMLLQTTARPSHFRGWPSLAARLQWSTRDVSRRGRRLWCSLRGIVATDSLDIQGAYGGGCREWHHDWCEHDVSKHLEYRVWWCVRISCWRSLITRST